MKKKLKIVVVFTAVLFAVLIFSQNRQHAQEQQQKQIITAGQKFKNIKILNEMPADQMGKVMNLMAAGLGVKCSFCHVEGYFSKDGKEEKETAREMLKMTFALNKDYFVGQTEVSCATCHNGRAHPHAAPNFNPPAAV